MTEPTKGVIAMAAACIVWGLSPLFYAELAHVPPLEVLAHRTLWSLVIFAAVLWFQGRLRALPATFASRRQVGLIVASAAMISVNWTLYIFAVGAGRTVEASLGYFIFPLVAVAIGWVVLRDRITGPQGVAVAMAAAAVLILTAGSGAAPWISLVLATTFGIYGLLKRWVDAGPVLSVTAEVLLFLPFAVGILAWYQTHGGLNLDARDIAFYLASGPLTAGPLILFSYAAKRVRMATMGLIQYLNPSLQFASAVLILGEAVTLWHMIAFPIIWAALALYSAVSLKGARPARP